MAILKDNFRASSPKFVEDATGALADVKFQVSYSYLDGVEREGSNSKEVSIWAALTAAQKTSLNTIYQRMKAAAITAAGG